MQHPTRLGGARSSRRRRARWPLRVGEAVANAARHGAASRVRVELSAGGHVRVVDDGLDPRTYTPGFGLVSMSERAEAIGAALAVRSRPGTGTEIVVELPRDGVRGHG